MIYLKPTRLLAAKDTQPMNDGDFTALMQRNPQLVEFAFERSAFVRSGERFGRVNSDGTIHDLAAWNLRPNGEFARILASGGEALSVLNDQYWQRNKQYAGSAIPRTARQVGLCLGVVGWALAFGPFDHIGKILAGALGAAGIFMWRVIGTKRELHAGADGKVYGDLIFKKSDVGPEPLALKAIATNGPLVDDGPDTGAAVAVDEYRPNT